MGVECVVVVAIRDDEALCGIGRIENIASEVVLLDTVAVSSATIGVTSRVGSISGLGVKTSRLVVELRDSVVEGMGTGT